MKYRDKLLPIYLEETTEVVDIISNLLVDLERSPENGELINELFRRVHTIKGSSSSIGFSAIATVGHSFETVLDEVRDGKLKLSPEVFAVLYEATDTLKELLNAAINGADAGDIAHLADKLESIAQGGAKPEVQEHTVVHVSLKKQCAMKQARVVVILKKIRDIATIVSTEPPEPVLLAGTFPGNFTMVLDTQVEAREIKELLERAPDVAEIKIDGYQEEIEATTPDSESELKKDAAPKEKAKKMTVRVDVSKLENMINLVGELVIERNRLAAIISGIGKEDLGEEHTQSLSLMSGQLGRITNELQMEIMNARMVPISHVFGNLPRVARDTAHALGKKINLKVIGEDTELDRTLVDRLRDPMVHLLRNAIDHGLEFSQARQYSGKPEEGTIVLRASNQDNNIVIEVSDDGRGINFESVAKKVVDMGLRSPEEVQALDEEELANLIFLPGFSTASQVSDISGRGVGLDAVRTELDAINGSISVSSIQGKGTTFTIRLPLTLAIIKGLLFEVSGREFALPLSNILETLSVNQYQANIVHGSQVIRLRGRIIPLVNMSDLLGIPETNEKKYILIVGVGDSMMGLLVDALIEKQEIVIKSLGSFFAENRELAGVTLLGNGLIVPILDASGLFRLAGNLGHVDKSLTG